MTTPRNGGRNGGRDLPTHTPSGEKIVTYKGQRYTETGLALLKQTEAEERAKRNQQDPVEQVQEFEDTRSDNTREAAAKRVAEEQKREARRQSRVEAAEIIRIEGTLARADIHPARRAELQERLSRLRSAAIDLPGALAAIKARLQEELGQVRTSDADQLTGMWTDRELADHIRWTGDAIHQPVGLTGLESRGQLEALYAALQAAQDQVGAEKPDRTAIDQAMRRLQAENQVRSDQAARDRAAYDTWAAQQKELDARIAGDPVQQKIRAAREEHGLPDGTTFFYDDTTKTLWAQTPASGPAPDEYEYGKLLLVDGELPPQPLPLYAPGFDSFIPGLDDAIELGEPVDHRFLTQRPQTPDYVPGFDDAVELGEPLDAVFLPPPLQTPDYVLGFDDAIELGQDRDPRFLPQPLYAPGFDAFAPGWDDAIELGEAVDPRFLSQLIRQEAYPSGIHGTDRRARARQRFLLENLNKGGGLHMTDALGQERSALEHFAQVMDDPAASPADRYQALQIALRWTGRDGRPKGALPTATGLARYNYGAILGDLALLAQYRPAGGEFDARRVGLLWAAPETAALTAGGMYLADEMAGLDPTRYLITNPYTVADMASVIPVPLVGAGAAGGGGLALGRAAFGGGRAVGRATLAAGRQVADDVALARVLTRYSTLRPAGWTASGLPIARPNLAVPYLGGRGLVYGREGLRALGAAGPAVGGAAGRTALGLVRGVTGAARFARTAAGNTLDPLAAPFRSWSRWQRYHDDVADVIRGYGSDQMAKEYLDAALDTALQQHWRALGEGLRGYAAGARASALLAAQTSGRAGRDAALGAGRLAREGFLRTRYGIEGQGDRLDTAMLLTDLGWGRGGARPDLQALIARLRATGQRGATGLSQWARGPHRGLPRSITGSDWRRDIPPGIRDADWRGVRFNIDPPDLPSHAHFLTDRLPAGAAGPRAQLGPGAAGARPQVGHAELLTPAMPPMVPLASPGMGMLWAPPGVAIGIAARRQAGDQEGPWLLPIPLTPPGHSPADVPGASPVPQRQAQPLRQPEPAPGLPAVPFAPPRWMPEWGPARRPIGVPWRWPFLAPWFSTGDAPGQAPDWTTVPQHWTTTWTVPDWTWVPDPYLQEWQEPGRVPATQTATDWWWIRDEPDPGRLPAAIPVPRWEMEPQRDPWTPVPVPRGTGEEPPPKSTPPSPADPNEPAAAAPGLYAEWVRKTVGGIEHTINLLTGEEIRRRSSVEETPFEVLTRSARRPRRRTVRTSAGELVFSSTGVEAASPPTPRSRQRTPRPRGPRPRGLGRR